ncbi:ABC transporter substrate-binding protein [Pseudonocardia nigra]|uniref:ABC transporter substrate-binding protein n=1 Tax=Pseudonocardia nigra TaxID=1921578 RepID=UPI001C6046C9|nr:ABC transporter substrate-binding protein [Pseudonocardia nigra]
MRPRLGVAAITAAALLLTACGGGGTSLVGADQGGGSSGDLETVNVGLVPTVNVASLFLGIQKGFFAEEGIEVQTHKADSGGAILTSLIQGSYDFAFAATVPGLVAASKGAPIKRVAGAGVIVEDGTTAVVVDEASGIDSFADLEGKTVTVNSLKAHFDLCLRAALDASGVDPNSVKVIELPFNQVEPSIQQGQVDAGVLIDPFLSAALSHQFKSIGDPCSKGLPVGVNSSIYLASERTVQDRSDLVQRFVRAITKSQEYANAHHDEVRAVLSDYTNISPEAAKKVEIEKLRTEMDRPAYQQLVEIMVKHGFISSAESVAAFAS